MADEGNNPNDNINNIMFQNEGVNPKNETEPRTDLSSNSNKAQLHPSYQQPVNYKNARDYAQVLHSWLWQYRIAVAFSTFHSQMVSSMSVPQRHHQIPSGSMASSHPTPESTTPAGETPSATTGTQYKIPMLWRRVAAEFLDFILLFYTKVLVTVAILRQMGYVNEDLLDLDGQIPFISDITELDYDKMFTLTSELIALEILNRLCITLVETLCLRQGYAGSVGGATPGKKIMHLKVVSFEEIREVSDGHIMVIGVKNPGFMNALVRSVIKNFSMAFFFPACFTAFFFRFNRCAYDVLAQTVVVEMEPNRNQQ